MQSAIFYQKIGNITPAFKKGCKSEASNYRPISLTSQIVKIIKSIISDSIYDYMIKEIHLFNCHQHGFIQGKSCFTNLLKSFQDWINAIDQGHGVDIVYLDYKKVFDSVPHQRLLHKLSICNKVLWWITNFLSNRLQRVVINGSASTWSKVLSSVPQGSVLGPLLFIIYVNDLPDVLHCCIQQYADDAKLYSIIKSYNDISMIWTL